MIYELTYTKDDQTANAWLSETLLPQLSALPAIEQVATYGNRSFAWYIDFDPASLQRLNISRDQLTRQLSTVYSRQELGHLKADHLSYAVFYNDTPKSPEDLLHLTIQPNVTLEDLATLREAPDQEHSYQRINGQSAIFINLYALEGVNRIDLAKQLSEEIELLAHSFPTGYTLALNTDDTEYLRIELDKTWTRAILSVSVILLMILISYRSWWYITILCSSILVSMAMTLLCLWLLDVAIHLYSIAGITIAMGILIDNAIILADHLRKKSKHSNRISGVLTAQSAAALSTIAALLIVLVLPEAYREDLTDFGWVISLALACSLLVSWWFTPAIFELLLPASSMRRGKNSTTRKQVSWFIRYQKGIHFLVKYKKSILTLVILSFGLPVFLVPGRWENQEWYNHTVGSELYQENLRPIVNKVLGGSLRLFYQNVYEKSAYRSPEKTQLYLNARLPYGHTLDQMNNIIKPAEDFLNQYAGIEKFITRVYSGRYASIVISFSENAEQTNLPYQLKNRLIQQSLDWGGVTWSVYGVGKGFSNATGGSLPGFQVTMKGYNYDALENYAEKLAAKLLDHRRIQEVNTNSQLSWTEEPVTLYRFRPDVRDANIKELQATNSFIRNNAMQLNPSLSLATDLGYKSVYISSDVSHTFSLTDALHPAMGNRPLNTLGQIRKVNSLSALHKENRQYIRLVAFDYYGSYRFVKKYLDEVLEELSADLPPGFSAKAKEWSWSREEEKRKYELLIVLMIILFFISTIFLENFKQALLITLLIPLSYIGLFLIFSWGGFSFDQGGYAAFLMIGGLSINAMYFILGHFKSIHTDNSFRALTKAIWIKAWPITMTVLSTCAGLLPFLIHGEGEVFWFSFAIGTIGGMMFSLIVSFFILPLILLRKKEISNIC